MGDGRAAPLPGRELGPGGGGVAGGRPALEGALTVRGEPTLSGAPRGALVVFDDADDAARGTAERFAALARERVREAGRFMVALTGGSSPVGVFRRLAGDELAATVPWDGVHLFWGDERCVPPAHPRSNFGLANAGFIERVPIPAENVHRIRGELGPERAAREYEAELRAAFGDGAPRFDLVHLGLGDDGHVASLFPFDLERLLERERTATGALHRELGEPRVTLTPPVLNAAARVEMLVFGAAKAGVLRRALLGPLDPLRVPAQLVRPISGELFWLLTPASARNLRGNGLAQSAPAPAPRENSRIVIGLP